jgi:hypothetical protein
MLGAGLGPSGYRAASFFQMTGHIDLMHIDRRRAPVRHPISMQPRVSEKSSKLTLIAKSSTPVSTKTLASDAPCFSPLIQEFLDECGYSEKTDT